MITNYLRRDYLSLAVFSGSALAVEIALTRILSTLYFPPFAFAVLSLALLGIGIGAALASSSPTLSDESRIPLWMTLSGVSALLLVPAIIQLATTGFLIIVGTLMLIPYIFIGLTLSTFFSAHPDSSRLIYAYDLIGAGLGAVLVIPIMNILGAPTGMAFISFVMIGSSLLYRQDILTGSLSGLGAFLLVLTIAMGLLSVDMQALNTNKPMQNTLEAGGQILETRWDAFARTDLVDPGGGQPYRIYVDGAAASVIPPATDNEYLMDDIGLFAFVTAQPETVFTIGSGGGLDVWFALRAGAQSVTAVEVNPQSVALVRDYADYSDGIYDRDNVRVLVDEGRSILRREDNTYDLIYLAQVVTLSVERSGYAFTENTVFTVEAFQDYWDHLNNEGYIAFKLYDEPTLSRALSIVIAMLNQQGFSDQEALQHTVALLDSETTPPTPLLIVRNTPFQIEESTAIGRIAQQIGFSSLYLPNVQANSPLDAVELGTQSYADVVSDAPLDISATTDNRPFFYQFERGIPEDLHPLLLVIGIALLVGLGMLFQASRQVMMPHFWETTLYFAMLGMSFIMVEIILIQYTRLFIGHPTTAITTVLAVLLISGGLGSAWYHRVESPQLRWQPTSIVAITIVIWVLIWSIINTTLLGLPLIGRIVVVLIAIAPLGFIMGIPFSAGLHHVGKRNPQYIPLAWSVNGVMTVAGSIFAVTLALIFGYNIVLIVGAIGYGIGAISAYRMR